MGALMSLRWADSSEALVDIAFIVRAFGFLGGVEMPAYQLPTQ